MSDGTHTASLLLLGQYNAANFAMASEGGVGGTLITYTAADQQEQMLVHSAG